MYIQRFLLGVLAACTFSVHAYDAPAVVQLLAQGTELESQQDEWQAALHYCRGARYGSTEAQYRLGMLYTVGRGVDENRALAAALFSVAATQGHAQAAQMLESILLTSVTLPTCMLSG